MKYLHSATGINECRAKSRQAVKKGLLSRPLVCDRCGKTKKLQMHHPDYEKPLLIRWLCNVCHPIEDRSRRTQYHEGFKRQSVVTLNLYLPSAAKKREIRKKAKVQKKSVSQIVVDHFDSLPHEG